MCQRLTENLAREKNGSSKLTCFDKTIISIIVRYESTKYTIFTFRNVILFIINIKFSQKNKILIFMIFLSFKFHITFLFFLNVKKNKEKKEVYNSNSVFTRIKHIYPEFCIDCFLAFVFALNFNNYIFLSLFFLEFQEKIINYF